MLRTTPQSAYRNPEEKNRGITVLLVVIIISVLFSISIGIFNIVFGELRLSGEITDSFVASFAADQSIERALYRDRMLPAPLCPGVGTACYAEDSSAVTALQNLLPTGVCYNLSVDKTLNADGVTIDTKLTSIGTYRCGAGQSRVVKRSYELTY